jgi:hypothetical protein
MLVHSEPRAATPLSFFKILQNDGGVIDVTFETTPTRSVGEKF